MELFQVTLDGSVTRLTMSPPGTLHYHPQPSSDGKWLAYGSKREGVRQLYIMRLADRAEKKNHRLAERSRRHVAALAAGS